MGIRIVMCALSALALICLGLALNGCGLTFDRSRNPGGPLDNPAGLGLVESLGGNVIPRTRIYVLNTFSENILVKCGTFPERFVKPGRRLEVRLRGYGGHSSREEITCFANLLDSAGNVTSQVDYRTFSVGSYSSRDEVWEPRFPSRY